MQLQLKDWLERRGITQYQLAKALGLSQPSVNAWVNGRNRKGERVTVYPDYDSLEKICLFLDVPASEMIAFDPANMDKTWQDFPELAAA
jgi:transcriptional regulator with XRE-family HTH domain